MSELDFSKKFLRQKIYSSALILYSSENWISVDFFYNLKFLDETRQWILWFLRYC